MVSPSPRRTGRVAVFVAAVIAIVVVALVALTETVGEDRRPFADDGADPPVTAGDGGPLPDGLVPADAPVPASYWPLPGPARRDVATNWTAFADSNLWVAEDTVHVVWAAPDGSPLIARRRTDPGAGWELFDLATVPGNPLAAPGRVDPHNTYAVAVDADGHVHVAGNMHTSQLRYLRSTEPGRIDSWTAGDMVGDDEGAVTYPSFTALPGGALAFTYRDGSSSDGDLILNTWDGDGWERTATVLGGSGPDAAPYPHRLVAGPARLHLFHVWRTAPGVEGNTALSYVTSEDAGDTWSTLAGNRLSTPIGPEPATTVHQVTDGDDLVLVNSGGAVVDRTGTPHALVRMRGGHDRGLWLAHPDGGDWRFTRVRGTRDAAGRGELVVHDRGMLALWPVRDGGATRVMAADVTDGDTHDDAVALLELPVGTWEPTAATTPGQVHLLVPAGTGDEAGIVTLRLADLPSDG